MDELKAAIKKVLSDPCLFAQVASGVTLRAYQQEVARAVVESVLRHQGQTFVVIFPRQSGKNELQANIEAYLLTLLSQTNAELVKISPTWKPQSQNAMRRLERILKRNLIAGQLWKKEAGYIFKVGEARMYFLSGSPTTNIVGATASTLLECDEAQDVQIEKWDKEVAPMAASTNATRVFWGTTWSANTLLAREMRAALEAERRDGRRRVWKLTADEVALEVPAYRRFVDGEIARHGREHPFIRTQYFSEEIDDQSGMFPAARLALMRGDHRGEVSPAEDAIYAFLLDVAGEDAGQAQWAGELALENPARDSTVLTVVRVGLEKLTDPLIPAGQELLARPIYRTVFRKAWLGVKHTSLYAGLLALVELWQPRWVVVDATGLGAGLASFLSQPLAGRLIRFEFTARSKSDLGWDFLSIVETGRYKEYRVEPPSIPPSITEQIDGGRHPPSIPDPEQSGLRPPAELGGASTTPSEWSEARQSQAEFWRQCRFMQMEVLPGPGKLLRWSVPDGTRDPASGELVHDDMVVSAALCAALEGLAWGTAESAVVEAPDIFKELGW